jgi:oligopeptide/dipeptide ABC transporter ATP-binding protein
MSPDAAPILELRGIVKDYPRPKRHALEWRRAQFRAVDGVSFQVPAGRTVAIVGESGSGKSTLLRVALGIERPSAGEVRFAGRPVDQFSSAEWLTFRQNVQPVLQDPWGALNPRMRVGQIVAEPLQCLQSRSARAAAPAAEAALREVGLGGEHLARYPHEFSGGQRQRIAIARALAIRPRLVLLDEPVSALDVSVRAQIVNLLKDLQAEHGLSYVLVSHDMPTVWSLSDSIVVLYRGKVMEIAEAETLRTDARSPYTQRLISSILPSHPRERRSLRVAPALQPPTPEVVAGGCVFYPLCPVALDRCRTESPTLELIGPKHHVACHRAKS